MGSIKVSVIVPVYNVEKYLGTCLDSILSQSLQDIEIICVDDGSTDDSLSILRKYEKRDSRFKVLTQTNQFAGTARNAGKAIATGKYLVFWDSDDFFKENALELMYKQCERDSADICVCSASHYLTEQKKEVPSKGYIDKKFLPKEIPFNIESAPDTILNFTTAHPWNKMFLRSFIEDKQLDFQTTKNGNDIYFVINALCMAKCITIVNKPLVYYRVNQKESLFGNLCNYPLIPLENWIAAHDNLISQNLFPERSFANKALNSIIFFLRNMDDLDAFRTTFEFLRKEGLAALSVQEQPESYYYSEIYADFLHHLINDSMEQFLLYLSHLTYRQMQQQAQNNILYRRKIRRLTKRVTNLKTEVIALRAETKRQKADLEYTDSELQKIRCSRSYRFARHFLT